MMISQTVRNSSASDYATGVAIVRNVLTEPARLIAANAGYDGNEVISRLSGLGPDEGFDALEGRYGDMIEIGIVDPLRVARSVPQNGASVACCSPPTRWSPKSRRRGAAARR